MHNAPVTNRLTRCAGGLLVGLLAASCGSGGGGGTSNPDNPQALKVTYVTSHRRDDWMRNEPIDIWFSAPLSKASLKPGIIERALQISIVTSSGRVPAKGCFSFAPDEQGNERRDRVRFDPTRVNCDSQGCADNPFGFQPLTTYDIFIPTPSQSNKFLTSTSGDPIVEGYDSFFTTGESYRREIKQPRYTGTDGQGSLGFDPPRKLNGEVVYNARVLIVFDDAMDPTTFDNGTTITVRNETLTALQGTPVLVPGNFVPDLCGRTWRFSPSFSFGGAGYDIGVILTSGLKDLSGNPLGNPQTIRFRTEVKAGVPTTQVINESFDLQTFMDTANTTADWGVTTTGTLQGGAVTSQDVIVALQTSQYPGGVRTRVRDHPFYDGTSPSLGKVGHEQWVYTQAELGTSAAITQVGWGPSSNALFASNHQRVQVTLGHTQGDALSTNMPNNFDVGIPVKVADSAYVIPQRATIDPPCNTDGCAVGYWPLPTFTNFFEYNGKNNVIVDIDATIGSNYQITRVFFGPVGFPSRNTFGNTGDTTGSLLQPLVQDMKFTKKRRTTVAQSLFYDSGQSNPDYATPILSPTVQTGGTSIEVGYEGAEGILFPIPSNPNNVIPDPTTYTGFVTNLDQLDSYRFIRFRIIFTSNVNTGQVPTIQSLAIPYIF